MAVASMNRGAVMHIFRQRGIVSQEVRRKANLRVLNLALSVTDKGVIASDCEWVRI